jgi:hypothetical protein
VYQPEPVALALALHYFYQHTRLCSAPHQAATSMCFCLQAGWGDPPDVWMQLWRHLVRDEACSQALLQQCTAGPDAAPSMRQMRQLAVAMKAELEAIKAAVGADA